MQLDATDLDLARHSRGPLATIIYKRAAIIRSATWSRFTTTARIAPPLFSLCCRVLERVQCRLLIWIDLFRVTREPFERGCCAHLYPSSLPPAQIRPPSVPQTRTHELLSLCVRTYIFRSHLFNEAKDVNSLTYPKFVGFIPIPLRSLFLTYLTGVYLPIPPPMSTLSTHRSTPPPPSLLLPFEGTNCTEFRMA